MMIEPLVTEPLHLLVSLFSRCECLEWSGRLVILILGHILKDACSEMPATLLWHGKVLWNHSDIAYLGLLNLLKSGNLNCTNLEKFSSGCARVKDFSLRSLSDQKENPSFVCFTVFTGEAAKWCQTALGELFLGAPFIQVPIGKASGLPGGSVLKDLAARAEEAGSVPGSGRSPRGGHGNPLWYTCLGNPMDRGAWRAAVHGLHKSWIRLNNWACTLARHIAPSLHLGTWWTHEVLVQLQRHIVYWERPWST